jgi:hypothetical protein
MLAIKIRCIRLQIKYAATNVVFARSFLFTLALSTLLLLQASSFAQQPWQKLSYPTILQVKASFQHPPSYYSNSVTWGWNGPMSREVIARDLDSLHALGFRAVTIEAGYKMPAEYLSDGWFKLVKIAVEEAKKRDMHIWIIDEGKYPSGFAGGKFSKERPDLRMQGLVVYERINASGGQTISKKITAPIVSAVAVNLADSTSKIIDVHSGELKWTAPQGNWQILLVQPQFKTAVTRAANNPTQGKDTTNSLCDYLNPVAVKQFINFTHEQYKKYVGDEFGKTVLGFRGDEPEYAYTPWTPPMLQEFIRRKGYDVQPYLASFFLRNLTDEQKKAKADYWDVWSDLFGKNFFQQQADWCAKNNVEYMVHLDHDDAMIGLAKSEGDFFKDFRSVQIPGIDVIWHQIWPGLVADFPKFASSAAHLFGRPRALSESFAAMNPAPDITQARWIINQQLVRGINLFEFMFFMSSSEGRGGARGYMADKSFPSLMAYANRASYLLAQGKPTAQIAVYFPTTSLWLGHNESEKSSFDIAQELLESQHDFDFIDEYSLTTSPSNKGVLVNKSGQEYNTIILPSINALSKVAYNRLNEFAKNGGHVIFTGEQPSIINDKNFLNAGNKVNFSWASQTTTSSLATLPSDVKLDQPSTSIKYLHRKWKDGDMYFFFNESEQQLSRNIMLRGNDEAQEWNAQTGTIQNIKATSTGSGSIQLNVELKPYETKFIVVVNK